MREWSSYEEYCEYLNPIELNLLEEQRRIEEIKQLKNLIAWADENNIPESRFPRDIQKLKSLTSLKIGGLQLRELSNFIGVLNNLNSLYIQNNKLTVLPESIGNLIQLNTLFIFKNKLIKLPESIKSLVNLKYLYVDIKAYNYIPESMKNNSNLKIKKWQDL